MQRRVLAWAEVGLAIVFLAAALWPFTGVCTGMPFWYDCEGWFIFSANLFEPLGVIALACGLWSMRTRSRAPHLVLLAAGLILFARLGFYALR